ncbi:Uncharacterised protein [Escherichia coli]|nr:Uncharacterised protein [Escherichia coli]
MTKMRNNAIFLAQMHLLTQRPARFTGKLWLVINNNPGYLLTLTGSYQAAFALIEAQAQLRYTLFLTWRALK